MTDDRPALAADLLETPDLDDETDTLESGADTRSAELARSPQVRLIEHLSRLDASPLAPLRHDDVVAVEFLGPVEGSRWGWIGEGALWGLVEFGAAELGGFDIQEGDVVRARVTGFPWHYRIEGVAPHTLERGGQRVHRTVQPSASSRREIGRDDWRAGLRPGDVVVARVPYSVHASVDRRGSMGKRRPAVFIRWDNGAAVVRGIYTATKDRYAGRNAAVFLVAEPCLDHSRIAVRDRNAEIPPECIERKIGELGEVNRGRIGIGGRHRPTRSASPASPVPSPPEVISRPAASSQSRRYAPTLQPAEWDYVEQFLQTAPSSWDEVIARLLHDVVKGRYTRPDRNGDGVALSSLGSVLIAIEHGHPSLGARPSPLKPVILRVLADTPGLHELSLVQTTHTPPVDRLVVRAGHTVGQERHEVELGPAAANVGPMWEEPPALIIYDQSWSHGHLGQRRVDLRLMLNELGGASFGGAYLVGPCIEEVASFHQVAERAGWNVICANSRAEEVSAARRIASRSNGGLIALVSRAIDMVRELEEDGHDVVVIDDLEPFLM